MPPVPLKGYPFPFTQTQLLEPKGCLCRLEAQSKQACAIRNPYHETRGGAGRGVASPVNWEGDPVPMFFEISMQP